MMYPTTEQWGIISNMIAGILLTLEYFITTERIKNINIKFDEYFKYFKNLFIHKVIPISIPGIFFCVLIVLSFLLMPQIENKFQAILAQEDYWELFTVMFKEVGFFVGYVTIIVNLALIISTGTILSIMKILTMSPKGVLGSYRHHFIPNWKHFTILVSLSFAIRDSDNRDPQQKRHILGIRHYQNL